MLEKIAPLLDDARVAIGHVPSAVVHGALDVALDLISTAQSRLAVVADLLREAA